MDLAKSVRTAVLPVLLLSTLLLSSAGCAHRGSAAEFKVRKQLDVLYVDGSAHPKHHLDLYLPEGRTGYPVVQFVHGGYWHKGDRRYLPLLTGLYGNIGKALARQGIGAVVPSYRLSPEVSIEAELQDVTSALAWTRAHISSYGGDPDTLFLAGHSAGGHMISLLAADAHYLEAAGIPAASMRGFISMSGVFDLRHMAANQPPEFNEEVTWKVFGRDEATLLKYSPQTHFRAGLPPMLVLVGGRDYPYLVEQTGPALDRLRAAGNTPESAVLEGMTHTDMVLKVGKRSDLVTPRIVAFVKAHGREGGGS